MNTEEYKLEIFLPESHLQPLQKVLQQVGAGCIGNYDSCLSYSRVTGCWRPLEGAKPYIGNVGEVCTEPELKVEVACRADRLEETLAAIRAVHPYEEPVIYVLPLCRPVLKKAVEVVAALIWNGNRFMICQRPAHKARGLLWEFVGGKVEPGETKQQALVRECRDVYKRQASPRPCQNRTWAKRRFCSPKARRIPRTSAGILRVCRLPRAH